MANPAPTTGTDTPNAAGHQQGEHGSPRGSGSGDGKAGHGAPEVVEVNGSNNGPGSTVEELAARDKSWYAYFKTRDFWMVLVLGQALALCITGTNTFTSLLAMKGTSIPAFQTFFNYVLLNLVYTGYTLRQYGFRRWARLLVSDGWKYLILAFFDVEGNYFVVLAYRYTTILSAQLINFWAIVIVVAVSFAFLQVRYHWSQVLGIFVCVGGMGVLLASDHVRGSNSSPAADELKGDLFALLGATCYGLSNVAEEFLVSKRPLYEVVGQIGFWGMLINGAQAGIFDRASFRAAVWDGKVAGYLVGYTLLLFLFYSGAPVLFRLSSAAFFNISLLTGNFWGVVVGLRLFGLRVHWMYPLAFALILLGHFVYYLGRSVLGDARKPWLGPEQERGVAGVGTARRRAQKPRALV
ncbi:MAG: hypothetical protein M1832_001429 [Thelocarpon impressellum]|nr:MAG: hypothetical protein M1832_001429 [Thelocarpon impressellum]